VVIKACKPRHCSCSSILLQAPSSSSAPHHRESNDPECEKDQENCRQRCILVDSDGPYKISVDENVGIHLPITPGPTVEGFHRDRCRTAQRGVERSRSRPSSTERIAPAFKKKVTGGIGIRSHGWFASPNFTIPLFVPSQPGARSPGASRSATHHRAGS